MGERGDTTGELRRFGSFMRGLDPLVAGEDTNAVYRAFCLRRFVHARGSLLRRFRHFGAGLNPGQMVLGVLAFIVIVALFLVFGCLVLPVLFALGAAGSVMFQRKRHTEHFMPRLCSRVFGRNGFFADAAVDLWMTGARGRDIVEAVYMEKRENALLTASLVASFLYILFAVLYLGAARQYHAAGIALAVATLWLTFESTLAGTISAGHQVRTRTLEPMVFVWESESGKSAGVKIGTERLRTGCVGLLVGVAIVFCAIFAISLSASLLSEMDANMKYALPVLLATAFLIAAMVLRLVRNWQRRNLSRKIEAVFERADQAFDHFMASAVLDDADGVRYGLARIHRTRDARMKPWKAESPPRRQPGGASSPPMPPPLPPASVAESEPPIVAKKDESGRWVAEMPSKPETVCYGDTREEAIERAKITGSGNTGEAPEE